MFSISSVLGLLAGLQVALVAAQFNIYVSPSGSDSNPGTESQPVATPNRAQELIVLLKNQNGGILTTDVTVNIGPGEYFLASPLNVTTADSGSSAHSVQWLGGTGATLSAGAPLSGWQLLAGFTDVYTTTAPLDVFPQNFVRQMWASDAVGSRRLLSRGSTLIASATGQYGVVAYSGQVTATAAQLAEAEVVMWHNWVSSTNKVAAYVSSNNTLLVKGVGGDPFFSASGNRFALQNVADPASLAPGTFFFSPSLRTITYRALPGEDPSAPSGSPGAVALIAERLSNVVTVFGTSSTPVINTHLVNLTIAHSGAYLEESCMSSGCSGQSAADLPFAALFATWTSNVTVSGCEFKGMGQYAAWMHLGTQDSSITGSWFHDLGAGGVRVGLPDSGVDPNTAEVSTRIGVTDNTIQDGGHIIQAGAGVLVEQASDASVVHNHIHHMLYTGVSTGWTWGYAATSDAGHLVGWNLIHDIFQGILSDGACVYNLGRSPGTLITNNVCHSVDSYAYGGWGLYTDEGSSNVTLSNNIVFNTKSASFHQHYGTDNIITNNIFAFSGSAPCAGAGNCDNAAIRSSQHGAGGGAGMNSSFRLTTNIILLGSPNTWTPSNITTPYYTTIPTAVANMTIDGNVYWTYNDVVTDPAAGLVFGPSQAPMAWAAWQAYGKDVHGAVVDPMFTDPGAFDFSLQEGSPALAMGFQPIDMSTVGPRTMVPQLIMHA